MTTIRSVLCIGLASLLLSVPGCSKPGASEALTIRASDFYARYKANPVGSDEEYRGKFVTIEGFVDHTTDTSIYLRTHPEKMVVNTIVCSLHQQHRDKLKGLKWGEYIHIRGRVTGWNDPLRRVYVEDCEILATGR